MYYMYHKHGVKLTKAQAHSLAKGQTIRLSHGHLHGPHEVHLTKTQIGKMQRSHANRVGTEIKLSGAQLRHNYKHGAGFLSLLAKSAAKAIAPMVIDKAASYAKDRISKMGVASKSQKGKGVFDFLKSVPVIGTPIADTANRAGNFALNNAIPLALMAATDGAAAPIAMPMMTGFGVKSRKTKGKGLVTTVLKFGAKALAPIIVDKAGDYIKRRIRGKGARSKTQAGGSFLPTGY